jgi:hypothetical protein
MQKGSFYKKKRTSIGADMAVDGFDPMGIKTRERSQTIMRKRPTLCKSPIMNIITTMPPIKDNPAQENQEESKKTEFANITVKLYSQYKDLIKNKSARNKTMVPKKRNKAAYQTFIARQKVLREEEERKCFDDTNQSTANNTKNTTFLKTLYPNIQFKSRLFDHFKKNDVHSKVFYETIAEYKNKLIHNTLDKYLKKVDSKFLNLDTSCNSTATSSHPFRRRAKSFH